MPADPATLSRVYRLLAAALEAEDAGERHRLGELARQEARNISDSAKSAADDEASQIPTQEVTP